MLFVYFADGGCGGKDYEKKECGLSERKGSEEERWKWWCSDFDPRQWT